MPKSKTNYFIIIQSILLFLLFTPIVVNGLYYYGFKELYLLLIYIVIVLITLLYFLELKKGRNIELLNKLVRIFSYTSIFILSAVLLWNFYDIFFWSDMVPSEILLFLSYKFSMEYVMNTEFGLLPHLVEFVPILVYVSIPFVFSILILKTNKLLSKNPAQSTITLSFEKLKILRRNNKFWVIFLPLSLLSAILIIFPQLLIVEDTPIKGRYYNWEERSHYLGNDKKFSVFFPSSPKNYYPAGRYLLDQSDEPYTLPSSWPEYYPQADSKTKGDGTLIDREIFVSEKEDNLSYFFIIDPCRSCDDFSDSEEVLEAHLENMSSDKELVSSYYYGFWDYPTLRFLIKDHSSNAYYKGSLFLRDQNIYTVMVVSIGYSFDTEDYQLFINSFQLLSVYE